MSNFERGEAHDYQVIWNSGHVETIKAHQVLGPFGGGIFGGERARWTFHREIDGRWTLVLDAQAEDIRTVRLAATEQNAPVPHPREAPGSDA